MANDELQIINTQLLRTSEPEFKYQEIIDRLIPVINRLLDSDMNTLMNILYRIDVDEKKVKEALATAPPEKVGEALARLMLDRQLRKIQTRRKYSAD